MGERCTVEGTVEHLIFQNEENGYTVLCLVTDEGEAITVVGCIPCVGPGEAMTVTGVWVNHPSYGTQLTAELVERRMPEGEDEIVSYLASGIIKGVGPATAARLVEKSIHEVYHPYGLRWPSYASQAFSDSYTRLPVS